MQFLCYVTFSNADSRISIFLRNFERSFTPRTWLRSVRNFGKTRFRRFASFHFSTLKKVLGKNFVKGSIFFQETGVLEELWISERHWQGGRKKLLPELPSFLGRLPWRGGKWFNMCRNPRLGTENDFNHLVLWSNLCRSIFVFKKLAFWRS